MGPRWALLANVVAPARPSRTPLAGASPGTQWHPWVLRTGAPWADLPDRYPSFQTCHRRFQQWARSGVMTRIMTALARELSKRGAIDVREAFIDASFAPAKKGGARSEKRSVAREQR